MKVPEEHHDDLLKTFLELSEERCPSCGYELRQLTGPYCPECGQGLRLRVGLENPNLAAFITGLVGLAAAIGFSGMLFVYVAFLMVMGSGGPGMSDMMVLLLETVVTGTITFLWIRRSGWIRRCQPGKRWTLAILCLAAPFIALFTFVAFID